MPQPLSQDALMTVPLAPLHYQKGHISVENALLHKRCVKGMLLLDRLAARINLKGFFSPSFYVASSHLIYQEISLSHHPVLLLRLQRKDF